MKSINVLILATLIGSCTSAKMDEQHEDALKVISEKLIGLNGEISKEIKGFYVDTDQSSRDSIAQLLYKLVSSDADLMGMYLYSPTMSYYSKHFNSWQINAEHDVLDEDTILNRTMRIGDIGFGNFELEDQYTKSVSAGRPLNQVDFQQYENDVMLVRFEDDSKFVTLDLFYKLSGKFGEKFQNGQWGTANSASTGEDMLLTK